MKVSRSKSLSQHTYVGDVVKTLLGNVIIQGANILCGVITARSLGPIGRGELAAIIMWPQFLAYALTLGIPVASIYHMRRLAPNESTVASTALFSSIFMGFIAAAIGWIVVPFSLHSYPESTIEFARLTVLLAPMGLFAVTLTNQTQCAGSFSYYNIFRCAFPLLTLTWLVAVSIVRPLRVETAALAYLLAGTPITVWNFFWIVKRFQLKPVFRVKEFTMLLSYGTRAWGADLISTVANQIDRLLVVGLLAPRLMGLYVVAQSAANLLNVLPTAISPILMPRSINRPITEIAALTGRAARITLLILLTVGIPYMLVGGKILNLLYGTRFQGAEAVFQILVVETILDGVCGVLTQAFFATGSPGATTILEGTTFLAAVPCLVLLVPRFGLVGAGCGVLLATSVRLLAILVNYPVRLKVGAPSLLITADDFSFLMRAGYDSFNRVLAPAK